MKQSEKIIWLILITIPVCIFIWYLFFVNLSTDTIMLFLVNKLFLGKWLSKGIIPFWNPHIFAGIPFLFDIGLGNLYPLNLLFILPYPMSFALWCGMTSFVYLSGFYLFFRRIVHKSSYALIATLILFCSGNGFLRFSNPTIFVVIAHFGWFAYALGNLRDKKHQIFALAIGLLLILSGHFQFVIYGLLLGLFCMVSIYKHNIKTIISFFASLGILSSWYFVLSMPIILSSTRLSADMEYAKAGALYAIQLLEIFFPTALGILRNGSSWSVGPTIVVLISLWWTVPLIFLFVKRKVANIDALILFVLIFLSTSIVTLPFLRNAAQISVLIQIWGLCIILRHHEYLDRLKAIKLNRWCIGLFSLLVIVSLILYLPQTGSFAYALLYRLKHGAISLFFDIATLRALCQLFAYSIFYTALFVLSVYFALKYTKYKAPIIIFVLLEGFFFSFAHSLWIPVSVVQQQYVLPNNIDVNTYRIQTYSDVQPYTGFFTYNSAVTFRPPFSKEPNLFFEKEQNDFVQLKSVFSVIPSNWAMVANVFAIQGYTTFVPKTVGDYFRESSDDYRTEYKSIISRNVLFAKSDKGLDINAIETSRVTMRDERWKDLAVRYIILPQQLASREALTTIGSGYVYENPDAPAIVSVCKDEICVPQSGAFMGNPNGFNIITNQTSGYIKFITNFPRSFSARVNGQPAPEYYAADFELRIPIDKAGLYEVFYMPISFD